MTAVTFDGDDNDGAFYGVDMDKVCLYVPAISVDSYRRAEGWKDFKNIEGIAMC